MGELTAVLATILLTDIINPVLFAFAVYAAGTSRPVLTCVMLLLGHTAAYFVAGIALILGLEVIQDRLNNPEPMDYWIEIGLGIALLVVLAMMVFKKSESKEPEETNVDVSWYAAFGWGALVNFIGIPFAIPYFAAVGQILKAELPVAGTFSVLLSYNVAYAVPFLVVPVIAIVLGSGAKPVLERIRSGMEKVGAVLMPVLIGGLGLALLADGIKYVVTGVALFGQ